MGLDMYLEKHTYVKRWSRHTKPEQLFSVTVTKGGKEYPHIDPEKVSYIVEQVGYWRKANAIHAWFVRECTEDGVDDCRRIYVEKEKLAELLKACKEVLADHSKANELLPPQAGFFFGSTEVDEYYFEDLEDTVKILEPILESDDSDWPSYYYQASW